MILKTEDISLRAIEPEDLDFLYRIENNPKLWFFSARKEPYSMFELKKYIQHADKSVFERGQIRFIVELNDSKKPIGTADLFDFDYINKKAEIGLFIDEDFRDRGFASAATKLLAKYAFKFLGISSLYAMVEENNAASKRFLQKSGFKKTAILQKWMFFDSKFYDIIVFQLFKNAQ